jgi:glutaminyl-tRNA synthetase
VRDDLNKTAERRMAVLDPLKVVIDNYPEGQVESSKPNNPEDPAPARARCRSRASCGSSATTSWRTRRRSSSASPPAARCGCATGYFITCTGGRQGRLRRVVELRCTYDPATRGGNAPTAARSRRTIHWVSAAHAVDAEVRLYEHLFSSRRD